MAWKSENEMTSLKMAAALVLAAFLAVPCFTLPCYLFPEGEADPCQSIECEYGARCVILPGGKAECRCPKDCPKYGDHAGARGLCATDATDYPDLCSLHRAACTSHSAIQVKYHGRCDPCSDTRCGETEICRVSESRVAQCLCGEQCPLELVPVCASDGKTYPNECSMRLEGCRTGRHLSTVYKGTCDSGLNPCSEVDCRIGEHCVIDSTGRAACRCDYVCEPVLRPVCGTDGLTYDSECHLEKTACVNQTSVKLAYNGVCGAEGGCSVLECRLGAVCVERAGVASCECPVCGSEFSPVCGTDGISYGNECKLTAHACHHHAPGLKMLYRGLCNGCETHKCDHYAACELDSKGDAICVCNMNCTMSAGGHSVCGSDGQTYANECHLKMKSCTNKIHIHVAYVGTCELCEGVRCQYGARCRAGVCLCPSDCTDSPSEPVCGSDMVTYTSLCHLHAASCKDNSTQLDLLFYGNCHSNKLSPPTALTTAMSVVAAVPMPPGEACTDVRCDYGGTCVLDSDGLPRCSCQLDCHDTSEGRRGPVCGSDLKMYPSVCSMMVEACHTQTELRLRPLQLCQGLELKPCNGDRPLVGPDFEDLDCGNGHNRQDCPTDYYCHQTPQFAKCCRKGGIYLRSCEDSWFGCCPDNKTPATGPEGEGCPSLCGCNKIGSYSDWCDAESGECKCRPGVGGPKCDRCEPGFWGLPKISSGYQGCLDCGCSVFGSVREDCEQMTGRCVCKAGVSGHKCDSCIDSNKILTHAGCLDADSTTPVPTSCTELSCYFGGVCEERDGRAQCACPITCPKQNKMQVVCGNDGQTYGSECQLKVYSCKYQIDISVQYYGPCSEGAESGTEGPVRRWTSTNNQFTQSGDSGGIGLSKSTRHLLPDRYPYSLPGRSKDIYVVDGGAGYNGYGERNGIHNRNHGTGRVTSSVTSPRRPVPLDESCTADEDCETEHASCYAGLCACSLGYTREGSTCIEDISSFTGDSWLRFRRMKAYHKFSLDLEVKSYNMDGIVFYTQQRDDGTGDFISLSIINGYVTLSYNLGSGAVSVSWNERIKIGTWHKVRVRRYQRDAMLQVDGGKAVGTKAGGTSTGLDLGSDVWLGFVHGGVQRVWLNTGTNLGLVGCLRLITSLGHPLETRSISKCEANPCVKNPCRNGGHCIADGSDYTRPACVCSIHFTGKHCEERLSPCVYNVCGLGSTCRPRPGGAFVCDCPLDQPCAQLMDSESWEFPGKSSWMILPKPERVSKAFSIELWLMPFADEGAIMYTGMDSNQHADFIALSLREGKLQFRFSLGDAPAVIMSNETLDKNSWHSVLLGRVEKEGFLQVDNGTLHRATSGGSLTELNLDLPLYVAGIPEEAYVVEEAEVPSASFAGVVSKITVNGVGWMREVKVEGAEPYKGEQCTRGACKNNSTCVPDLDGFTCKCLPGFAGPTCDIAVEDESGDLAIRFDGHTILRYPKRRHPLKRNSTNLSPLSSFPEQLNATSWSDIIQEDYEEEDDYFEENSEDGAGEYQTSYDDSYDDYQLLYDEYDDDNGKNRGGGSRVEVSLKTTSSWGGLVVARGRQSTWALVLHDGLPAILLADLHPPHLTTLVSKMKVSDDTWHHVTAIKRRKSVIIQVDEEIPVKLRLQHVSPYPTSRFTIGGGWRNRGRSSEKRYEGKFDGCLSRIKINNKSVRLATLLNDHQALQTCSQSDNMLR